MEWRGNGVSDAVITAWIAAGSAVAGALAGGGVTGWFTLAAARRQAQSTVDAAARQADAAWEAGRRQADAAWEAGRLQAEAQLDVARQTLAGQHLAAQREVRRAAYATFLAAADAACQRRLEWQQALGTAQATGCRDRYRVSLTAVAEALTLVRLEGPDAVSTAALTLEGSLEVSASPDRYQDAHAEFLSTARTALAAP